METKRFKLRRLECSDAEMIFRNYASDDDVTKYLSWYTHKTISDTIKYLDFSVSNKGKDYGIIDKITNEVVGAISIVKESVDFNICEVGYCLSKKYWNKGVMTEILNCFLDYLFNVCNYKAVFAKHIKENIASGLVMQKCGMHYSGEQDELFDKQGWVIVRNYTITRYEYSFFCLHKRLSEFFQFNIPVFSDLQLTFNELKSNGFLVKRIDTIESDLIYIKNSDYVYVYKEINNNIVTFYFICLKKKIFDFNNYIHQFMEYNASYIISVDDKKIEQLIVAMLKKLNFKISFAESCTGGLMASTLISVSGVSSIINESYVTYSIESKERILGVKNNTIDKYSVYSKQTAVEMVEGLHLISNSNICVAITGLAGSNVPNIADGTYDFAIGVYIDGTKQLYTWHKKEYGDRNSVRHKQVNMVFYHLYNILKKLTICK